MPVRGFSPPYSLVESQKSNGTYTTASLTMVMCGFGAATYFTPQHTGSLLIICTGQIYTNTGVVQAQVQAQYGTGTAPTAGAAQSGTVFYGPAGFTNPALGSAQQFGFNYVLPGLTVGTRYWIDLSILTANASDSAVVGSCYISVVEVY